MSSNLIFKPLETSDIPFLMDIYNHFVVHTTHSFHTEPVALPEFTESVVHPNPRYQTYVILLDEKPQGYVQVMPHKKKQAYDTIGEVTIYLHPDCVGKGLGSTSIQYVEAIAKERGFHSLIATVCANNSASIHMFTRNGYEQCAYYKEVGFKWGQFLDIVTFQKIIS